MDERTQTIVGIDVSKDRLDVHLLPSGEHFTLARDEAGLKALSRFAGEGAIELGAATESPLPREWERDRVRGSRTGVSGRPQQ